MLVRLLLLKSDELLLGPLNRDAYSLIGHQKQMPDEKQPDEE
jgi:hypothetical protein